MYPQSGSRYLLWNVQRKWFLKLVPDIRFVTADGKTSLIVDPKHKSLGRGEQDALVQPSDAYQRSSGGSC